MTQIIVDISQIRTRGDTTSFVAEWDDNRIERQLKSSDVITAADFAAWVVHQNADEIKDDALRRRLVIDFHTEEVIDPDTGLPDDVPVVDTVTPESLPEDVSLADIAALPGWATWTATEAEAWINTNVVDLDSSKVALVAMAKLHVATRELVRALAERVR